MSNVMSFTGTLGRDAEVKCTAGGMAILTANVACNTGFGDNKKTMWIRCSVFGKRAEGNLVDYLKKGQMVFVTGELTQNEYQAQDGTVKTSLELNASIIDLIGGQRQESTGNKPTRQPAHDNFDDNFDDDIPF